VASAADVDPALVYNYYGTKESLLDAATVPPQGFLDQIVTAWQTPSDELGEHLVRQMLCNWEDPNHGPHAASDPVDKYAGVVPGLPGLVCPPVAKRLFRDVGLGRAGGQAGAIARWRDRPVRRGGARLRSGAGRSGAAGGVDLCLRVCE
jgi:AcrR family transcriptional regulator